MTPEFTRYGSLPVGAYFRVLKDGAVWQKGEDSDRVRWTPEVEMWGKLHMEAPPENPERLVILVEVAK